MASPSRGRSARTKRRNDRLLKAEPRQSHGTASLAERVAAPLPEAMRKFIDAGLCPFCGRGPFQVVATHCNQAHGVDRHELREMAGMMAHESTASPEHHARMSKIATEGRYADKIQGENHSAKMGVERNYSEVARAAMARNVRRINAGRTPEERASIARQLNAGLTPQERSERARRAISALTPEKRAAVAASQRHPHGTVACYRRGCRRDECKAAFSEWRRQYYREKERDKRGLRVHFTGAPCGEGPQAKTSSAALEVTCFRCTSWLDTRGLLHERR